MSADNYYVVKKHPAGGFTYVMGFASDEHPHLTVDDGDPKFATLQEAIWAVRQEFAEYGYSVEDDCLMSPAARGDADSVIAKAIALGPDEGFDDEEFETITECWGGITPGD